MKEAEWLLTLVPWGAVEAAPAWLRVSVGWQLSASSCRPRQISERRLEAFAFGAHQVCRPTLSRTGVTTDQYPQFALHRIHLLRISRISNL